MTEADDLYGLPLDQFTSARNELAARLRKQGDRAGSEAVKRLAKPSITAWALNQAARRQGKLVDELLSAGDQLRSAQQALLAGGRQAAFREAQQAEREAAADVVQAAAAILGEAGHPAGKAALDRLEATARAAATDDAAGQQLRSGCLTADLDPTGFGGLGGFGQPAAPIPFRASRHAPKPEAAESQADVAATAAAREEARRLQHELQTLRSQAADAEAEAARTRQAATKAREAATHARETAQRVEEAAAQADRARQEAAEDLARLRSRIDETADALERAERSSRSPR